MKEIYLTNSPLKAQVSDEDYFKVCFSNWMLEKHGYVKETTTFHNEDRLHIVIARFMKLDLSLGVVDHKDTNKRNCDRENLRIATHSENHANSKGQKQRQGNYKGVTFDKRRGTYFARLTVDQKSLHLGTFTFDYEAALAYNEAALKYFGPFALLNEIT